MGRHSAPRESKVGPTLIKTAAVVTMAAVPVVLNGATAQAASTERVLEVLAHCESGNRNVNNSTGASTASGYWQIINGTWKAYGGTEFASRAIGASRTEQEIVARRVLAGQGIKAWEVYGSSCWNRHIGSTTVLFKSTPTPTPTPKVVSAPKTVKTTATPVRSVAKKVASSYVIKRGDTLVKIAARNGTTWRKLYNLNRGTVKNPALIYTGNTLRLR